MKGTAVQPGQSIKATSATSFGAPSSTAVCLSKPAISRTWLLGFFANVYDFLFDVIGVGVS